MGWLSWRTTMLYSGGWRVRRMGFHRTTDQEYIEELRRSKFHVFLFIAILFILYLFVRGGSSYRIVYQPSELERVQRLANITAGERNYSNTTYNCLNFSLVLMDRLNYYGFKPYLLVGNFTEDDKSLLHAWVGVRAGGRFRWVEATSGRVFLPGVDGRYFRHYIVSFGREWWMR
jgi:hypothetical protein